MENQKKGNYNPEDRDSETQQAGTNRDNLVVNKPGDSAYESGTNSNRNEQYNAGGTGNITGTTSVSDARNAGEARAEYDTEDEDLSSARGQFDSANPDDESDDFLTSSEPDYEEERKAGSNKLDPDFDRNSEV